MRIVAFNTIFLICSILLASACAVSVSEIHVRAEDTKHTLGVQKADIELAAFIKSAQQGNTSGYTYLAYSLCGELCLTPDNASPHRKSTVIRQLKEKNMLGIKTNYIKAYAYFLAADRIREHRKNARMIEDKMTKDQIAYAKALANIWIAERDDWAQKRAAGYETEEEKNMPYICDPTPKHTFEEHLEAAKRGGSSVHAILGGIYCGEFCITPRPNLKTIDKHSLACHIEKIKKLNVTPNYKLAYAHYILADNFKTSYTYRRKKLATVLTKNEIREAKALAKKWDKEADKWNKLHGQEKPF